MLIPFPDQIQAEGLPAKPISPMTEMVAYEALWRDKAASFKQLSRLFASQPGRLPSDFVSSETIEKIYLLVKEAALNTPLGYRTNLLIHGSFDYPTRLREAEEPVEILYYSGNLDLLSTTAIAVVGTRNPTESGRRRAGELTRFLVEQSITVVSGLAAGIDTVAHITAINEGGNTIAVIGTPLDRAYPAVNKDLQTKIAKEHLLISQVPFIRYREQPINLNRLFFLERNKTMSALTKATIIVEAGETSGTLTQARAGLAQGRKVFILDECFRNNAISWPARFQKQGAIRVNHFDEILKHLK